MTMTPEEILEREAQSLARPCELIEATELGEGKDRVTVVLYNSGWVNLPGGERRMRETRIVVHGAKSGMASLIVGTEFASLTEEARVRRVDSPAGPVEFTEYD